MDHATPNLPSRKFDDTIEFYSMLGFDQRWRDATWMILARRSVLLEFFPHPDLDPATSWFSCCLRLDDLEAFYATCVAAGITEGDSGAPRLHKPTKDRDGRWIGALIDPDGTLVRMIQND